MDFVRPMPTSRLMASPVARVATPDGAAAEPTVAETVDGATRWRRAADESASRFIARVIADAPETGFVIAWPKP
jgi:hypothetical protein